MIYSVKKQIIIHAGTVHTRWNKDGLESIAIFYRVTDNFLRIMALRHHPSISMSLRKRDRLYLSTFTDIIHMYIHTPYVLYNVTPNLLNQNEP